MPTAHVNNIDIFYETRGNPAHPPVLLLAGTGDQLIWWDEEFVDSLVSAGLFVVRCDLRDVGRSTKFDDVCPDPWTLLTRMTFGGEPIVPPYTVQDMVADVTALLRHLRLKPAYLIGTSYGGELASLVAIHSPEYVRGLVLIATNTASPDLQPTLSPEMLGLLITVPAPRERAELIEHRIEVLKLLGGNESELPEEYHREKEGLAFDRSDDSLGRARQKLAIFSGLFAGQPGERRAGLQRLKTPALHCQGTCDPLVPAGTASDFQSLVPDAQVATMEGMGHLMFPQFTGTIRRRIVDFVRSVEAQRRATGDGRSVDRAGA